MDDSPAKVVVGVVVPLTTGKHVSTRSLPYWGKSLRRCRSDSFRDGSILGLGWALNPMSRVLVRQRQKEI